MTPVPHCRAISQALVKALVCENYHLIVAQLLSIGHFWLDLVVLGVLINYHQIANSKSSEDMTYMHGHGLWAESQPRVNSVS